MKVKLLIIFLVYLFLFILPGQVAAEGYPPGSCPDCERWNGKKCVNDCKSAKCQECLPTGDGHKACLVCGGDPDKTCCEGDPGECCNTTDPNLCYSCVDDKCRKCGGDPFKECCKGSCCDKPNCEKCTGGACKGCDPGKYCCPGSNVGTCCNNGQDCCTRYYGDDIILSFCCDPDECETCVGSPDGVCLPCGGDPTKKCCPDKDPHYCCPKDKTCCQGACCDPNTEFCCEGACCDPNTEFCCDGSCCDKVWTKETVASSVVPCSSCSGGTCPGTTTEINSYEKCEEVGAGQGEHCQCFGNLQTVGHKWTCMIVWDLDLMETCAAKLLLCTFSCIPPFFEPASCADCLSSAEADCCSGPCEVCNFIEDCVKDPLTIVPQKRVVFSSFGC